jgi:hypothetical protein
MQFMTAKKFLTLVIRPARNVLVNGYPEHIPALRVKFRGGLADTDGHASEFGWSDEERQTVEDRLLRHHLFNRPGGFYLGMDEKLSDAQSKVVLAGLKAGASGADRCVFKSRTADGMAEQCSQRALKGPYCLEHAELVGWTDEETTQEAEAGVDAIEKMLQELQETQGPGAIDALFKKLGVQTGSVFTGPPKKAPAKKPAAKKKVAAKK